MTAPGIRLQSAVRSHVGHVRALNEDACLVAPRPRHLGGRGRHGRP